VAEACDGAGKLCPADGHTAAGTTCRASAGPCDAEESCSGASAACPADAKRTGVCRPAADEQCDVPESCDGAANDCPTDQLADDGEPCDDGETCSESDACSAGSCAAGIVRETSSASLKISTREGALNDRLTLKAVLPLASLQSTPDEGGLSIVLAAADSSVLYDAEVVPGRIEDRRGDGLRFQLRSDDPAAEDGGIRQIKVTLVPDRGEVRVVAKATAADLDGAPGEPSVSLIVHIGDEAAGDCVTGLDLACSSSGSAMKCEQ
jgi:hypothetical protein